MKNNLLKRIICILMCFVFAVSFIGCKDEQKTPPKQDTDTQSKDDTSSSDDASSSDGTLSDDTSSDDTSSDEIVFEEDTGNSIPSINIEDIYWSDDDSGSGSGDGDDSSEALFGIENMFDGNNKTYWALNKNKTTTTTFSLEKEKSFNTIIFEEISGAITDYIVELKQGNEWVQVYRQDQMGSRTGVLDKTFTAKDVRLTVTTNNTNSGGIAEIKFELVDGFSNMSGFANVGYYTAKRMQKLRDKNYSELHGLTDIIFFNYGSFTIDGDYLWGEAGEDSEGIYDEQFLQEIMAETKEVLADEPMRMWFSLGNYHPETTTDNALLFGTEEARQKLTKFCVELCDKYGFYGIDIDYEFPTKNTENPDLAWANYNKFIRCVGKALHAKGYKFSAALPPWGSVIEPETVQYIDRVNSMVYDSRDVRGNHSPYANVIRSINYYLDLGFNRSQIIVGIPFYEHKTEDNTSGMTYEWVVNRWRDAIQPWTNIAYSGSSTHYFNGPVMVRDKVFYCMQQGIGGVFCWVMGADVPDSDPRSLSLTVENTIKRFSK